VDLIDTVGQHLRLCVENSEGGGGQRHIVVYAPYWVVNTTQYSLRIKEDGSNVLPAGTVSSDKYAVLPDSTEHVSNSLCDLGMDLCQLSQRHRRVKWCQVRLPTLCWMSQSFFILEDLASCTTLITLHSMNFRITGSYWGSSVCLSCKDFRSCLTIKESPLYLVQNEFAFVAYFI
jgi:hypothetical protein